MMKRIFIDREWCVDYILLAIESIDNSANKERTVNDLIKEIEAMFNIYTDDIELKKLKKKLIKKLGKRKILLSDNV